MLILVEAGTGIQWMVKESCITAIAMGINEVQVFVEGVPNGITLLPQDVDRVMEWVATQKE